MSIAEKSPSTAYNLIIKKGGGWVELRRKKPPRNPRKPDDDIGQRHNVAAPGKNRAQEGPDGPETPPKVSQTEAVVGGRENSSSV